MADTLTAVGLGVVVLLEVFILVYGLRAYARIAGTLRTFVVLLLIATGLLTLRTILHSARYLLGLGLTAHFGEHIAILAGFAVMGLAAWKVHAIMRGES